MSKEDIKRIMRHDHIVTPKLTRWLVANGGPDHLDFTSTAGETMLRMLTTPSERKQAAFHPSQLAGCMRAQVFSFLGVPFENNIGAELRNLFLDGQWRHLRWQAMGLEAGIFVDVEVPLEAESIRLTGSADALGEDFLFELKGIYSLWQAQKRGAMPDIKHIYQIHCYFLLLRLCGYKINRCALVYEDKQFQKWNEYVINVDESLIADIHKRLGHLNNSVDKRQLPNVLKECERADGKTYNDCSYSAICLGCRDYSEAESLATSVQIGRGSAQPVGAKQRTIRVRRSAAGTD